MAIEDSVSLIAIILFDNAVFFLSYLCDTNCTHQSHNITSNGQPMWLPIAFSSYIFTILSCAL